MKRKKVWRFYCEHCRKAGCGGGAIAKHERGCCHNPARECGCCRSAKFTQKPLAELIAAFTANGIEGVRACADGCPACMLAAVIQSGIDRDEREDFDYRAQCDAFWERVNNANDGHGNLARLNIELAMAEISAGRQHEEHPRAVR